MRIYYTGCFESGQVSLLSYQGLFVPLFCVILSDKYILKNHCPYLEKRMCVCYNWFASQIVWLGGEWIGSTKRRASDGKADPAGLCQAVSGKRISSNDHVADS